MLPNIPQGRGKSCKTKSYPQSVSHATGVKSRVERRHLFHPPPNFLWELKPHPFFTPVMYSIISTPTC